MKRKTDARKLSPEAQEEKRRTAINLRKQGMKLQAIAEATGVSRVAVSGWWKRYKETGSQSLQAKKRGRKMGEQRTLSSKQESEIKKMIVDKTPDQIKMPFALWSRQAVGLLIKAKYGIKMPVRTIGLYLERWGFTPQKPAKRAYEQRPEAVKKWLNETYPQIAADAKKEAAEIHWGDETGLRSDDHRGRGYAPKGMTPLKRVSAKRSSVNLISTVTNQGKVRFMIYDETFTAQMMIKFLKRLIKDANRMIFLILDNLRVHHAKLVQEWLGEKEIQKLLRVFYLPSYSPELNPDEYLNCDLKGGVFGQSPIRDKESLKKAALSHLRLLQKKPQRVQKYFKNKYIAYAA
jgi:transposase